MPKHQARDRGHYGHKAMHQHEVVHERMLRAEHRDADHDHPLSYHYDTDHDSCVLPEDGSHSQGQDSHHDGYGPKRGMGGRDGRKAGSGY